MSIAPWRKLAAVLKQGGVANALRHYRTVALHRAHAALDGRFHPYAADDATTGKAELDTLTIESPNRDIGVHYLPTPWRILDWVQETLPEPDPSWTFVDYGCGKGRVVLSAARRPFGRVVGVEFASELAAIARVNVANLSYQVAHSVEVVEGDATRFTVPDGPLVAFLFNPFGPPVLDRVAEALARSWQRTPRPIVVAYLNPLHETAFARLGAFSHVPLFGIDAMRFELLSPYRLALYATPDAARLFPARNRVGRPEDRPSTMVR
ncbi:MAG: class I SAM-dependent methyltransferase [Hyphomicrobiaceae bacterium]